MGALRFHFADADAGLVGGLGGAVAVATVDDFGAAPGFGAAVLKQAADPPEVDPTEVVAYALVSFEPRDRAVFLAVHTVPKMRRRGIASRLYDVVEKRYAVTVRPSVAQTREGAALWRKRSRKQVT